MTCLYPRVWFCIPPLPVPPIPVLSGKGVSHHIASACQGMGICLSPCWPEIGLKTGLTITSETAVLSLIQVELGQACWPNLSEWTNRQATQAQWLHSLGKWAKNNSVFISGRMKLGLISWANKGNENEITLADLLFLVSINYWVFLFSN